MIRIGEYIEATQPYTWRLLVRRYLCFVGVDWERLMKEPPRPA